MDSICWTSFLFLFIYLFNQTKGSNGECNCQLRSGESDKEPLIIRSYCNDDFAWKVFVRSDKSEIEFKDSKNITYNRYDVRVTKVYKDSKNTTIFSEGFVYTPQECTIQLQKTRFVILFGYYDKNDGKPVISECQFTKLIDELSVGERLFLMGAYRRMDCLDRFVRPPAPGSPGLPGRPASMGFAGPPFIPGLPGLGGLGGLGGLPGVGEHGIIGGHGGTGGMGGTAFGSGAGGHGGNGGTGGTGTKNKLENKLEYTKDLDQLNLKEVVRTETRRKRDTTAEEKEGEEKEANSSSSESSVETTSQESTDFGAPDLMTIKPNVLNLNPVKDLKIKGLKEETPRLRWPLGKPQSSWSNNQANSQGNNQGWHSSTESPASDLNLCSIASFKDLPQCTSDDWAEVEQTPKKAVKKPIPRETTNKPKPRPQEWNNGWPAQDRPQESLRPIERPNERPIERPIDRPIERPNERPIERPISRPVPKPRPDQDWEQEWEEPRPFVPTSRPSRTKPSPVEQPGPPWQNQDHSEPEPWYQPKPNSRPKPQPQPIEPQEWSPEWTGQHPSPPQHWSDIERPTPPVRRPKPQEWNGPDNRPDSRPDVRPDIRPDNRPQHSSRPKPQEWNGPDIRPDTRPDIRPDTRPQQHSSRPKPSSDIEWPDWAGFAPEQPTTNQEPWIEKPKTKPKPQPQPQQQQPEQPEWWPQGSNWPETAPPQHQPQNQPQHQPQNPPQRRPVPRPVPKPEIEQEWPEEWQGWSENENAKKGKPKQQVKDSFSCSCNRLRQLEESCSATFADTLSRFFSTDN